MTKILSPFCLFFWLCTTVLGQEAISVDRVDFKTTSDDWIQMEVELSCDDNPAPDARDKRYVEAINIKVYLAFLRDAKMKEYDYYISEVDIVIMEKGDDNNVYFYLPGLIAERDQLPSSGPEYYYVEVSVKGEVLEPKARTAAMSSNIRDLNVLKSFVTNAESKGKDNEHILMPVYYAPAEFLGRVSKLPTFLRRDVRE
ncbi:MAG: hypothetical protein ACSHX8_12350 [Opitutaceae bacterium]